MDMLVLTCTASLSARRFSPSPSHRDYYRTTTLSLDMQRSDVVLAELDTFLQAQDCSQSRIILAVASETSSLLPCCKQSLGFKNAHISKLWSASHWKTDGCRIYWKDAHLVCVRKYRPNSTYASVEQVKQLVGDAYEYLHEMPPALSPLRRVSSKPILGVRSPSSVTSNGATRTLRSVSSHSKLGATSPRSSDDLPSPSQKPAVSRTGAKPRASEPVATRMPTVRSPIITRRRSNTALHAPKPSPSPQPPVPTRPASSARSPPAVRPLIHKASDSALALRTRGRTSTGAPRSVSGSAIPTPVRRSSMNVLDSIIQGSPASPIEHSKALRASLRYAKSPASHFKSVSMQTEPEPNPLMDELVKLEDEFDCLKREHETTLAYTRELGLENQRLRKQKSGIVQENEMLKESKKALGGTIKELKEANANLIDENGWIVVCKTEQEEKAKQLELENEKLASQVTILSNQRKELESMQGLALCTREQLNDALDEISRLQVQAAAARMTAGPMQNEFTPMKTPVTRFKEAFDPVTVYRTPYMTPVKQISAAATQVLSTPTTRMTPRSTLKMGSISARKVRTPLTGQKHGLRFWKRMAKRRMFA